LLIERYAMPGAGENPQCDGNTAGLELLGKQFCLPHRNAFILRAVQQQHRSLDLVYMMDRRASPERLGKPVAEARGADVGPDGVARFDRSGMIRLVAHAPPGNHVLTLVVNDPGLKVYVFTFGP
jgi:hypothetical protein